MRRHWKVLWGTLEGSVGDTSGCYEGGTRECCGGDTTDGCKRTLERVLGDTTGPAQVV